MSQIKPFLLKLIYLRYFATVTERWLTQVVKAQTLMCDGKKRVQDWNSTIYEGRKTESMGPTPNLWDSRRLLSFWQESSCPQSSCLQRHSSVLSQIWTTSEVKPQVQSPVPTTSVAQSQSIWCFLLTHPWKPQCHPFVGSGTTSSGMVWECSPFHSASSVCLIRNGPTVVNNGHR
jgi:hypothetical protein